MYQMVTAMLVDVNKARVGNIYSTISARRLFELSMRSSPIPKGSDRMICIRRQERLHG